MTARGELIHPERRVPALSLPAMDGGALHPLRAPGRRSPVLVLVDDAGCERCRGFVGRLEAARGEIEEGDGRVLVIVPGEPESADTIESAGGFLVLADADRRTAAALHVSTPAVVIADQWGQVHDTCEAGQAHSFPAPGEIVEWLRYLSIQCPECEGEAL